MRSRAAEVLAVASGRSRQPVTSCLFNAPQIVPVPQAATASDSSGRVTP